jgi:urease accessory protein
MSAKPADVVMLPREPVSSSPAKTPLSEREQLLLATWLSPAFPIGAFSYSHGVESVIADGTIADASSLEDWIGFLIERGSGWCDAVLLAEAWRAVSAEDEERFAEVAELASALAPSRERQLETMNLGTAFLLAVSAGWPNKLIDRFKGLDVPVAYPVAVGLAAAAHEIPLLSTLAGFLNSFAGNLISVAVRLVPLGQSEGLTVLARLQPLALATAERAVGSSLDDLGSAAILSDIASMRHETLHSRVFRS